MMDKVNTILEELNEEQKRAVCQVDGPVLIVAGAGSGKTRVLTSRVAYILALQEDARILALTFTKKAAGEMKERIAAMVGDRSVRRVVMGTFHAVFVRFLREYAEFLGYPQNFTETAFAIDVGDVAMAEENYGVHIIKRLELDTAALKDEEYTKSVLASLDTLVASAKYSQKIQYIFDELTVNEDVIAQYPIADAPMSY